VRILNVIENIILAVVGLVAAIGLSVGTIAAFGALAGVFVRGFRWAAGF